MVKLNRRPRRRCREEKRRDMEVEYREVGGALSGPLGRRAETEVKHEPRLLASTFPHFCLDGGTHFDARLDNELEVTGRLIRDFVCWRQSRSPLSV